MTMGRLPRTPATHLRLALVGLAAGLLADVDTGDAPFASDYLDEAAGLLGAPFDAAHWHRALAAWTQGQAQGQALGADDLPLRRLAAAGLEPIDLAVLLATGLVAEDPRLAPLLGDDGDAMVGGVIAMLRHAGGSDDPQGVRQAIMRLIQYGLIMVIDPDAPRLVQRLRVPTAIWETLGGNAAAPPGCVLVAAANLPAMTDVIADDAVMSRAAAAASALSGDPDLVLVIRGPHRNGRSSLAGAIAHSLGRPLMTVDAALPDDAAAWARAGLFAFLTDAVLFIAPALAPGECRALAGFALGPVRMIAAMADTGSIALPDRPAVTVSLPAPGPVLRQRLWRQAVPALDGAGAAELAASFRLSSGTIHRAAVAAMVMARESGDATPSRDHVRLALMELQDNRLESLATRIAAPPHPEFLVLEDHASEELDALAARCRHREALAAHAGPGPGALGVRALFSGPSGAGKTLAARRLAQDLARDLWRIDLAASVSKYIGETEKALDRAFAAAEERDIILLLDEGDALMARRTDVGNANDRYANLETNFLLQRIEAFSGILIVTTNAAERIDAAFARRMDVVVPFRAPDEIRRYAILAHHLDGAAIADDLLQEVAVRCVLTGGQLRNIALHARLLAMDAGRAVCGDDLRRAVVREYRKLEIHCPLKPMLRAAI
ncbi:ATP-binding protein [Sandarakinorhabdus sp.]|uniref:ATP-binding protein n=1 Tax=Sandarakinorhabdus sp. TaxID=1916663 RepID=UPI00286D7E55|nr:ATP-binding protein [Sandarakinorhabdus sp.]